jgi:hypothetical protein
MSKDRKFAEESKFLRKTLNYAGVQSINDAFHIVKKVENVFVYTHIFNLIDNVEYVVYALYSSMAQ